MISEERLKELIKQEATIYKTSERNISIITLNRKMQVSNGSLKGVIWEETFPEGGGISCVLNIKNLFETEEEAVRCYLQYCETENETLTLPSWEYFDTVDDEFSFVDADGLEWELYSPDKSRLILRSLKDHYCDFNYNKKWFDIARHIIIRLWKGEEQ